MSGPQVRLDDDVAELVDALKDGDVSTAQFVNRALRKALAQPEAQEATSGQRGPSSVKAAGGSLILGGYRSGPRAARDLPAPPAGPAPGGARPSNAGWQGHR